jgi:four helix bundle protein
MEKIRNFTDLIAWQKGHELVLGVYELTKEFPDCEKFGLTNQIQRATVSITSNIAEGFSRGTDKDKIQFYRMAQGSVTEVQNQLIIARDLQYVEMAKFSKVHELSIIVSKLINGMIKKLKNR